MLRFKFVSGALAAGVVQFASAGVFCGVAALVSIPAAHAQEACATGEGEIGGSEVADSELLECGEALPALDLSLPAIGAAALSKTRTDKPVTLPDETGASAPLPLEITPAETGASARASLQSLRNFQSQKQARKVQDVSAVLGAAAPKPKPAAVPPGPLDLWTRIDAQGFDASDGRSVKSGAGLDYRVVKNAHVGVVAERAESVSNAQAAAKSDDKVAAYVAFRALPVLTINAQGNWERTAAADPAMTAAGEKTSVAVAPRLSKSYALGGGETIAPYLEVKREIEIGAAADVAADARSAAAGVTLAKPDSYSVTVSADVSEAAADEAPSVSSKVQLKLPLH